MAKTPSDSEEQLPQGESPYPLEPTPSDSQRPRFDHLQIAQAPLMAILAIAAVVIIIVVIVLFFRKDSKEAPSTPDPAQVALESQATQLAVLMQTQTFVAQGPTPTATLDPTLEALQAQATQLALVMQTQTAVAAVPTTDATREALQAQATQLALVMQTQTAVAAVPTTDATREALQAQATQLALVMQTQTAVAQLPMPTATAQVVVVTATPEPQLMIVTPTPPVMVVTSAPGPQVMVVTATSLPPTARPAPAVANCGSRSGDDINLGRSSGGPCRSMPLSDFLAIMNADRGSMPKPYFDELDAAFDRSGGDIGYQYREAIPAYIPASSRPAMRVMWGNLGWLGQLSAAAQQEAESRILRLRCESQYGVCIYLLKDASGFEINAQGRGVLLSEPLNPEAQLTWWGK